MAVPLVRPANRVTQGTVGGQSRSYGYDASSNLTSATGADGDQSFTYDATDALIAKTIDGNSNYFAYTALGDLATSYPGGPNSPTNHLTAYTYDPASHLESITADGTTTSFTIDALGRHATQTIGADPTTTYGYIGTSQSITTLTANGTTTTSGVDAIGDRITTDMGGSFAYVLPDLHGNVVATISSGSTPIYLSAYRYDPYGQTCATYVAGQTTDTNRWRFQGRILESASGSTDLYDFGARSYDPSLGTFTSFDSVTGGAQNPVTLNRYLYANGNPSTFTDPSGHATASCTVSSSDFGACDPSYWSKQAASGPTLAKSAADDACANGWMPVSQCGGWSASITTKHIQPIDMTPDSMSACAHGWIGSDICISSGYDYDTVGGASSLTYTGIVAPAGRPDCGWNPFCAANNAIGTAGDIGKDHWQTIALAALGIGCGAVVLGTVGVAAPVGVACGGFLIGAAAGGAGYTAATAAGNWQDGKGLSLDGWDIDQASTSALGSGMTLAACAESVGIGCVATGSVTSMAQYGLSPGEHDLGGFFGAGTLGALTARFGGPTFASKWAGFGHAGGISMAPVVNGVKNSFWDQRNLWGPTMRQSWGTMGRSSAVQGGRAFAQGLLPPICVLGFGNC